MNVNETNRMLKDKRKVVFFGLLWTALVFCLTKFVSNENIRVQNKVERVHREVVVNNNHFHDSVAREPNSKADTYKQSVVKNVSRSLGG